MQSKVRDGLGSSESVVSVVDWDLCNHLLRPRGCLGHCLGRWLWHRLGDRLGYRLGYRFGGFLNE